MAKPKTENKNNGTIDIAGIMARIPHRYPMLLIDRIIDVVAGESCTGIKNVSANEPFFQPGVIDQAINKAVAQGVTYVTAAGNSGISGFEQAASFVSAGDGSGDYLVNFNPSGAAATRMTVT